MSCAFSKLLQGCLSCLLGLTVNDFLLAQRTLVWRYCLHSAELPCLCLARGDLCHDAQTVATSCRQSVESRCALAGLHFAYLDVDKFSLPFKSRPGHIWKVYSFWETFVYNPDAMGLTFNGQRSKLPMAPVGHDANYAPPVDDFLHSPLRY